MHSRSPLHLFASLAALLSLSTLCGCGLLKTTVEMPGRVASAATGSKPEPPPDPNIARARLMRFADVFSVEITKATREFAERAGSVEGNIQALTWRIDYMDTLWKLASEEHPFASLFDAVVVITFVHSIHEERWLAQWGEADRPMVDSLARLEDGVWALAGESLTEKQLAQMRSIIDTWMQGDPAGRIVELAKLPGFSDLASLGEKSSTSFVGELTDLMSVDPLSGLEPAVQQVVQARLFAERVFYYFQRMPDVLSAQAELMALRAGNTPQATSALASVERVSQAAVSLAATAEALPAQVSAEREAALAQVSAELTAQREGLVKDIETARAPLTEMLASTRGTVEASKAMSDSLTQTLTVLDAFVGRFVPKKDENAGEAVQVEPEAAKSDKPPGKPFDITEYGAAAERIGIAARELGTTVATLDRSLPEVQKVLDEAGERAQRSLDHLFLRAFQLLGAALAGVVVLMVGREIAVRGRRVKEVQ